MVCEERGNRILGSASGSILGLTASLLWPVEDEAASGSLLKSKFET